MCVLRIFHSRFHICLISISISERNTNAKHIIHTSPFSEMVRCLYVNCVEHLLSYRSYSSRFLWSIWGIHFSVVFECEQWTCSSLRVFMCARVCSCFIFQNAAWKDLSQNYTCLIWGMLQNPVYCDMLDIIILKIILQNFPIKLARSWLVCIHPKFQQNKGTKPIVPSLYLGKDVCV